MSSTLKASWESILQQLSKDISRANLITWFQKTALLEFENGILTVGIPRQFFLAWHTANSKDKIQEVAKEVLGNVRSVEFSVDGNLDNPENESAIDVLKLFPKGEVKMRKLPKRAEVKIDGEIISKMISPKYSLQNFVVGSENRLAYASCKAVGEHPGGMQEDGVFPYNPLFIYGGVGLGKTHLLQATGNEILRKNNTLVVLYLTAESFVSEIVEGIQKRKMEKVREKYRKVDVLILDDIQFFAGKDRSQEVFFHIFNDLYDAGKQIILSSDKPPAELELTADRLRSRFSMGLAIDVQFPDYETRLAIVRMKAQEIGLVLENEILNFIAFNVHHSIREIEGVLREIRAQEEFEGVNPTIKGAALILRKLYKDQDIVGYDEERNVPGPVRSMDDIVEQVADFYSVTKTDVLGKARNREFVIPRQVAMFFCKKYLRFSLQRIGTFFSGRDHTSVIHSLDMVKKRKKTDPQFWRDTNTLRKELGF